MLKGEWLTFVVLESHDEFGAFLESVEEALDQVADVFGIGTLEGELLTADGGQGESLREGLAGSGGGECYGPLLHDRN